MYTLQFPGNTARNNVASPMVNILLRRQLLQNSKLLDFKSSNNGKQEVLPWLNTSPKQVKSYTENNLNLAKVSMIDPILSH